MTEFEEQVAEINQRVNQLQPGERLRLEGIPNEVYHATAGDGSTMIKLASQAPKKYRAAKDGKLKFSGKALDIGSAFHCLVLEPLLYSEFFVVAPPELGSRATKAYKGWAHEQEGKTILTEAEHQQVCEMADSCLFEFKDYLKKGSAEVSYWYRDKETSLILKARTDYERDDFICDLKSTQDASVDAIQRSIMNYGYYLQHALYLKVTGKSDFVFLFTESKPPYISTGPIFFDSEVAELGQLELRKTLSHLSAQYDTGIWPGYASGPIQIGLRPWELKQLEELREELMYD